jgi:hypothetical protein
MMHVFKLAAVPHSPTSGATGTGDITRIQSGDIAGPALGQSVFPSGLNSKIVVFDGET